MTYYPEHKDCAVSKHTGTTDSVKELHAKLHADDLHGWQKRESRDTAPLDEWVKDNAVHALESCPRVLEHWKMLRSHPAAERILFRYVGAAFDGQSDTIKTDILLGKEKGKAQQKLCEYLHRRLKHWLVLSPLWVGESGSDLRAAAVKSEWIAVRLFAQVLDCISRPEAARWSQWIPYAHSIAVAQRIGAGWEKKGPRLGGESFIVYSVPGQSWAKPVDIALAQSLIKYMPHCCPTLSVHPNAEPISAELQERMDAFVGAHVGLGMMPALQKMIVEGTLHTVFNEEAAIALPDFEDFGL